MSFLKAGLRILDRIHPFVQKRHPQFLEAMMNRSVQMVMSLVVVAVVGGLSFFFYQRAKKQAEQAQKGMSQKHKSLKHLPKEVRPLVHALNKQGLFVQCEKALEESRRNAIRYYYNWMKNPEGPTGKERYVNGIHKINGLAECKKFLGEAAGIKTDIKPLADVEKTFSDYVEVMEKMVPLVDKMHQYYKDEDYKDDKFAKGKQYHTELMTMLKKVMPMVKLMGDTLDKVEDDLAVRRAAYYKKKYGEEIRYLMIRTQQVNKRLVIEALNTRNPKVTDPAPMDKALKDVQLVFDKLDKHVKANKDDIKEKIFRKDSWGFSRLESLVSATREFITLGKKLARGFREASADPKKLDVYRKKTWETFGDAKKVLEHYNRNLASLRLSTPW